MKYALPGIFDTRFEYEGGRQINFFVVQPGTLLEAINEARPCP